MATLKLLTGSFAVYAIIAACSGGKHSQPTASGLDGGSGGARGDHVDGGASGADFDQGAFAGAFTDPTRTADAAEGGQPAGGESGMLEAVGTCDTSTKEPYPFATIEFPGKTTAQLARAVVLIELSPGGIYKPPPGFNVMQSLGWVSDGKIAVQCGDPSHTIAVHAYLSTP